MVLIILVAIDFLAFIVVLVRSLLTEQDMDLLSFVFGFLCLIILSVAFFKKDITNFISQKGSIQIAISISKNETAALRNEQVEQNTSKLDSLEESH